MATTNKIVIGIDDQVIELTGKEKDAFLEQRAKDLVEADRLKKLAEAHKALVISAYTKLGLTEEEINAIL